MLSEKNNAVDEDTFIQLTFKLYAELDAAVAAGCAMVRQREGREVSKSQFIREAVGDKLRAMGIPVRPEAMASPSRVGKGGRPRTYTARIGGLELNEGVGGSASQRAATGPGTEATGNQPLRYGPAQSAKRARKHKRRSS